MTVENALQMSLLCTYGLAVPMNNFDDSHMQADLEPATAAELWPYLEVVAGKYGLQLGSPSAAGCGAECVASASH